MKAISTKNLTKKYKSLTAVNELNLDIEEGELFALLGVNGAGKTTTIRMLSCLSTPSNGTAQVFGYDVVKEADKIKSLIGISTQDTAVAANLTVEENLRFMAGIMLPSTTSGTAIEEKTNEMIELFDMDEVRQSKAKTLSGGWQRKLSIAMALIGGPRLIYLDEPTLGLDVLARRELWKIIKKLKGRVTIVLTTHYMEEAEALADRIGVMIKGRLSALGTLEQLEAQTGRTGLEEVFVAIAEQ